MHGCLNISFVAVRKPCYLRNASWLILAKSRNMSKSLKYVPLTIAFFFWNYPQLSTWLNLSHHQMEMLSVQDFMALLAYDEPEKSPMFHLLSSEHRQNVAESLNRAILGTSFLIWHASDSMHLHFSSMKFVYWLFI